MRRVPLLVFIALALAVAVGLGTAVSPWASPEPDGLEVVAEEKGFLDDATGNRIQDDSPIPDYAFPGIENERVATGVAGFVGTLGIFVVGVRHRVAAAQGDAPPRPHRRGGGPVAMGGWHAHAPAGPVGDLASPVHRLDPRAKIVGLVGVTVVGVTTPLSAWPAWVACAAVLVAVAAAGAGAAGGGLAALADRAAAGDRGGGLHPVRAGGGGRLLPRPLRRQPRGARDAARRWR